MYRALSIMLCCYKITVSNQMLLLLVAIICEYVFWFVNFLNHEILTRSNYISSIIGLLFRLVIHPVIRAAIAAELLDQDVVSTWICVPERDRVSFLLSAGFNWGGGFSESEKKKKTGSKKNVHFGWINSKLPFFLAEPEWVSTYKFLFTRLQWI